MMRCRARWGDARCTRKLWHALLRPWHTNVDAKRFWRGRAPA